MFRALNKSCWIPHAQIPEKIDKRSLLLIEQPKFRLRFGQMRSEKELVPRRKVGGRAKERGSDAVGGVRAQCWSAGKCRRMLQQPFTGGGPGLMSPCARQTEQLIEDSRAEIR